MKVAYLDPPTGLSGDMLLGALVDLGVSLDVLQAGLAGLSLQGYELRASRVQKNGLGAIQFEVLVHDEVTERHLADILAVVRESGLDHQIKAKALTILQHIGEVEAHIHGVEVEHVHLHELGGIDTIVDIVGVLLGLQALGVEKLYAAPLPMGRGFVRSAHGQLPLPSPATLALLEGLPVTGSPIEAELVTPTGAALVAHLVTEYGPIPAMRLLKTGYGAGRRDLPVANVLRLLVGEIETPAKETAVYQVEKLTCLECNIDNMNPELYSYLFERLFAAGALDVSLIPVQMKKNRPGTLVQVLCQEAHAEALLQILFTETTTLGARKHIVERYFLERHITVVHTAYGEVRVKYSRSGENQMRFAPEYEDCRRLAAQHGVPLQHIYLAAQHAAEENLPIPE